MATQQEIIQKLMKSLVEAWSPLNGGVTQVGAVDIAFKAASDNSRRKFNSMQEVIDAFLVDCGNAESAEQFLREKCGIILDNEDNGSITGLDIGGTKLKTDETIVLETSEVKRLDTQYLNQWDKWTAGGEVLLDNGNATVDKSGTLYFEKLGLTVKVPDYNKIIEAANDSDKAKSEEAQRKLIVVNGLYSWWIEGALQLIKDSYGDEFSFEENNRTITVVLHNDKNSAPAAVNAVNAIGFLRLSINMYYLSTISSNNLNGNMTVSGHYLDHTLTHELTHAIMAAKFGSVSGDFKWWQLPRIIVEGTAELTKGIDKIRKNDMLDAIEKHRSNGYLADILDYDTRYESDNTRQGAQYAGGYMLLRYLAKQCATEETTPITIGASKSITCTLDDGMLVKANNGTAALQKGDVLVTDDYGDIATIKIGNENNIISTPESKTMVVVKDHNNNDIASIFGSASVHDNGFIQKNFSAIDVKAQIDNATVVGSNEKDEIVIEGNNASVVSNGGNDLIKVTGNNANISGTDGKNEITVTGNNAYVFGGQSDNLIVVLNGNDAKGESKGISTGKGNDEIQINGNYNSITSGMGDDTIAINGTDNTVFGGSDFDKFVLTNKTKNNTIKDFSNEDELYLESSEIAAEIQANDEISSVVISSAKTGDTLVVLSGITSGSNNNITYRKDDGTISTSIDWLLANTTPINPNPDNPEEPETQKINVQPNGNVNNTRDDVIINAVSGNNVIQNSGNDVTITGGTDKDEVSNNANNVTIDGKAGNDVLSNGSAGSFPITHARESFNGGDSVIINGGLGADLIYNYLGVNVELRGGEDNDTINNTGNNVQITGDSGNDEINNNGGDTVTVDGGDGKDTLFSSGKSVSIFGDNGEDSIRINASGANATVNGGNDDDNISNYGSNALIDGGSGNDYLYNRGTDSTINSGMGNDSIRNLEGTRVLLYGGEDNDDIRNGAENVTIEGGSGDDSIDNNAANVSILGGEGKDTITHRNGQSNNVTIDGGAGDDSISNLVASNILINGGEDNDTINNTGNNVTINSGSGNDSIVNNGEHVTIEGAEGDDTINNSRKEVFVNGGAGADSIDNGHSASNVTIYGGDGNDTINNEGKNVTIDAGKGDDIISLSSNFSDNVIEYTEGDGNDTIFDYYTRYADYTKPYYTLKIKSSNGWSSVESNNDLIIKVGSASITLKDAKGTNQNIIGIKDTTPADTTPADTTPADTTPADTTPADTTPADTTPADTTPADTTPADTTPPDTTPPDTTPADTTPSGQDQSSTIQIIKETTGIDVSRLDSIVLTDSDSIEEVISGGSKLLNISSDSGVMDVDLRDSDYRQIVSLGGGNQNVQFNDKNGNAAIVGDNATGWKNIIFGNGTDVGIFTSPKATTQVSVGSGNDSIITDNNARVRVDMTDADNTQIIPYSGRIILDNYNPDSRAEIVIPDVTDITSAIKDNSIQLVGNEIRPNSSTRIKLNDSDDSNIVNLTTEQGNTQKVGFTGINGGTVDTDTLRGNFLLKGNYVEKSSDSQKRKPSTLISGKGHDTILAGARDFVDGGDGKNQIYLTPYDLRQTKDGATIALSGNGRNTVHGFHEGFGYDDDVIQVDDFDNLKFKFYNDGLVLTSNDSRLKFDGIGTTSASADDSTNSLGTDKPELIQLTDGSSTMRAAIVQNDQSVLVQEDDYTTPNAFFGNRSGLNFSDYSGSIDINLADGTGKLDNWNATFHGINKLQAGDGMSTLIGDAGRNTLIAGNGYTSIWGGAGNDTLIGKGGSSKKDGRTTFFFFAGDGHDVIYDFNFLTPQNYYSGDTDKINIGDCDINDAYCSGDDVILALDDDSYLTIKDAEEKNFQINNMIAQVGNELHYDGIANTFANNGNRSSSLIVDSNVRSAEIWLDSSHGTLFFGHISTLDASAVDGRTSLVGNEFNNTIIAGQDDASLWGGSSSSDDLLIGGNSRNTFFYCNGNGRDTIQATTDRDAVILSDVFLDDIVSTNISADFVDINFIDGGSLRINGNYNMTYQLADGSKYSVNHEHLEWDSR